MRSWFPSDGFTRYRCPICSGTGFSAHRDVKWRKLQQRFHELDGGHFAPADQQAAA